PFEQQRDEGFPELPAEGTFTAVEKEVSRQLLRNGAAAFQPVGAADIGESRPYHAYGINTPIAVENPIPFAKDTLFDSFGNIFIFEDPPFLALFVVERRDKFRRHIRFSNVTTVCVNDASDVSRTEFDRKRVAGFGYDSKPAS